MDYGLWDIGRWPWAVKRSWVLRCWLSNGFSKVCSFLFIGYVWVQVRSLVNVVRMVIIKRPNMLMNGRKGTKSVHDLLRRDTSVL